MNPAVGVPKITPEPESCPGSPGFRWHRRGWVRLGPAGTELSGRGEAPRERGARRGYGDAVLIAQRSGRAAAVALLAGLLLAGCAGAAPASSTAAAPGGASGPTAAEPGQVELPWPAAGAADAAALQSEVDGGAQPWLLDPSAVALSYVAAAHDWTGAEASPGPDGTTVDVRGPGGDRLILTLAQPGRVGAGGIWVVTAERRT